MKVLLFSVVLMLMACVGSAQSTDRKVAVEEFGLTTDLDGNDRIWLKARISNAAVDVGCYERSPVGMMVIVR